MSDSRPLSRRRIGPIGALTATALLGTALLGVVNLSRDDDTPTGPRAAPQPYPSSSPTSPPAPSDTASTAIPGSTASTAIPGTGAGEPVGVASAPVSLHYTFDGGPGRPVADTAGRHPLRIVTEAGGALNFASVAPAVPAGPAGGLAMQFPPRCDDDPAGCPRAILEGERDDALNPGTRPLRFGASVLMSAADTADGANVVQKGYSIGGGSQFKLQIDHRTAYPSCVVAGKKIHRIEPRVSIADGAWHTVTCNRRGGRLGIAVDGVPRGSVSVPAGLSIANAEPLRIGGKGAAAGNDQFAGQIDNVFLAIG